MSQSLSGTTGQMRVLLKSANKKIFRALLSIASAALLIRIIGMLNQIVVTARFGEGAAMDAYFVASVLPIMVSQLLGGTIEASVIPAYARVRSRGTAEQKSVLFSTVLNLVIVTTVLLTLVMFLFRDQMIFVSAPALDAFRVNIASNLVFIIYPVLALMTIIGFLECILNTEGQFGWPSYAGLIVPITTGVLVLFFGKSQGVVMLCIGMIVGLCLQLVAFILRTRRLHIVYRPIIHLRNPDIQLILIAAWPAFLGATISQASLFIDQIFASFLSTGNISALNYALKLNSVAVGVVFMSAGRAALPYLSQQAAIRDMKAFRGTLHLYSWVVGLGTLIFSVLMLFLAHPIIQILFQHGAFTAVDTDRTAWTFIGFVVGLVPMSFNFVATRAFSALGKNRVLVLLSVFNVLANALFDGIFAHFWQSEGIALATSAVYFGTMFILYFLLCRTVGNIAILSMPPEIRAFLKKFDRLGLILLRTCIVIGVFTAGIMGIIINDVYTLRISLGSVVMLVFLRYRIALLISWMVLDAFIGSSLAFFGGNNIDTALTVPTILLLAIVPVAVAFKRFPALGVFSLFLVWVFASISISTLGLGAFLTTWMLYIDCLVVCILTIHVLTTRRRVMILIDTILLVAQFVALYGIYGYFTHQNGIIDVTTYLFRIFSIFASSPTLGLYLSIMLPLMIFRTVTLRGFMRLLGLMGIVVLLACLILTLSRSAFICVPLSILLMVFLLPSRKLKAAVFGGIVVLSLAVVMLATIGNLPIFDRFFNQDILTLNNRTYLWQALLDHFDPTQLLGNGLGASNILLNNLQVGYRGVIAVTPHNLFLETLYDHGIIGLSLLLLVFITIGINLVKGLRKATGEHRVLYAASLAVLVNVFIQGFDSNDLWMQSIHLYFWVIMALPFVSYWPSARGGPAYGGEVEGEDTSMENTFPQVETPQAQMGRQFRQPVEQLHHVEKWGARLIAPLREGEVEGMGNRLRICFICFMFAPIIGGAEARAEKQARQLQALGHEVTILTLRHDKGWKAVDSLDGLRVIRIGGLFRRTGRLRVGRLGHFPIDIALLRTLWRLRHSFDIIHVFQISSLAAVAAFIGKLTGIRVIISTQCAAPTPEQVESMARGATLLADTLTHADYLQVSMHNVVTDDVTYLPRSALGGGAMLRFLRNADAYYQALSTRSQSYLAEQGFRLDHIVRISGSVNTEKFRPAPERRPDARQPERLLLCVARLEYSKGVDVLLHAWGRMMREGAIGYQGAMNCAPTIVGARDREGAPIHFEQFKPCLLLVGEGVLRTQLERMVEELGIGESVKFLGMRTDVIDLLQQAWGFVLPSRWEGMPNALLEAMACGLPCVATSVSGSEDILVDGVNGLLVPPEQPVEMAQALRRLIANEELAQRLGREARATVVRDYQLTTIVEQCLELYRHVLSRRSVLAQVGSRRSDPLWSLALRTGTRATTRDRPYENHIPTRVGSQGTSRGYPDGVNRSNNE